MANPGRALRSRIEDAYDLFLTAFDDAGRSSDTSAIAELNDATDVLMRALAQVILQINQEDPD
jgi:hypothetical protein